MNKRIFKIMLALGALLVMLFVTSCARWDKEYFSCENDQDCPGGQVCCLKGQACKYPNWCFMPPDSVVGDIVKDALDNGQ